MWLFVNLLRGVEKKGLLKSMQERTLVKMKMTKLILAMIMGTSATFAAWAQAPLAGQAGSDTLKRAQTPNVVNTQAPVKDAKPSVAKESAAAEDSTVIGVISSLALTGDAAFIAAEDVEDLLTPALVDGQEKTIGDLKKAIAMARAELIERGYYLISIAPASAAAYHKDTQVLDLVVDPGYFGDVTVEMKNNGGEGDWYNKEQVEKRFKYVKKGAAFNYFTLRQALRQMNGHPDLCADTKLKMREAKTEEGENKTSVLTRYCDTALEVDDSFPFHASLDINNYAMDELDKWQAILTLQYLNLTGADDVLTVSPAITMNGDMWSIAASYVRPFEFLNGGSWSIYGGYSRLDCDGVVNSVDLLGTGGFAGLNTSWNIWDTENRNIAFNLGVQWRYIEDEWSVLAYKLQKRDLNILPLTAGFSYADKRRDWLGGLDFFSISESVELLGGRDDFRRYSEDADPNYLITRLSWARLQPLLGPKTNGEEWRCWSWYHKIEAQFTSDNLITAERLAYGGNACLRGYRRRGYLGDSGVYGTGEIRTPVFCDPITAFFRDSTGKSPLERIQFFVFTDAGYIAYTESYQNMEDSEFLWSAGFGVRAGLTQYASLNLDVAFPLEKGYADKEDEDCEVYLSVKFQF